MKASLKHPQCTFSGRHGVIWKEYKKNEQNYVFVNP